MVKARFEAQALTVCQPDQVRFTQERQKFSQTDSVGFQAFRCQQIRWDLLSNEHKISVRYSGLEKPRVDHRAESQSTGIKLSVSKMLQPIVRNQQRFRLTVDANKQGLMVDHAHKHRGCLPGVLFLQLTVAGEEGLV